MPAHRNLALAAAIAVDGRPKYLIAALSNMAPNVLGRIVAGAHEPSESQRAAIAGTLNTAEADLFGES